MDHLSVSPVSVTSVRDAWDWLGIWCNVGTFAVALAAIVLSVRTYRRNPREPLNASGASVPVRLELDIRIRVVGPPSGGSGDEPQSAENEAGPERKRQLLAVARGLGGAAKSIAINVASEVLEHRLPH